MQEKLVPVPVIVAVDPHYIRIDVRNPMWHQVMDTLGSMAFETLALHFLQVSKESGVWMGVEFPIQAPADSDYAEMVRQDMLSETQTESGWLYALTGLAITRIYHVQAEKIISAQARELQKFRKVPFLTFLRQLITSGARFV